MTIVENGNNNKIQYAPMLQDSNIKIEINGNNNIVTVAKGVYETLNIIINGNGHNVTIEENVNVESALFIYIEDHFSVVHIGKNTTFVGTDITVADNYNSVIIGEDCMFSNQVSILASDFHSIIDVESGERINFSKGIHIQNHVWIGQGISILKNVEIGENSIIALGSIVNRSLPNNSMWGAIRILKNGVTWSRKRLGNEILCENVNLDFVKIDPSCSPKYAIDKIVSTDGKFAVDGWCFLQDKESKLSNIYIKITDNFKHTTYHVKNKMIRRDVATAFQDERYSSSGFSLECVCDTVVQSMEIIIENKGVYSSVIYTLPISN